MRRMKQVLVKETGQAVKTLGAALRAHNNGLERGCTVPRAKEPDAGPQSSPRCPQENV